MKKFTQVFNSEILMWSVNPTTITRDIQRSSVTQADRVIAGMKALGLDYAGCMAWTVDQLSFEWTIDSATAVETVSMFKVGVPVPLLVIEYQKPWSGITSPTDRAVFIDYHYVIRGEEGIFRDAVEAVLTVLQGICLHWLRVDLQAVESWSCADAVKNIRQVDV